MTQLQQEARGGGHEICGALIGDRERIRQARPLFNHSARADAFFMAAADVRRVEEAAEAEGMHVVGFYHSHPHGNACPSRSDLEHALPGFVYVIVAAGGDVRAWRLRDDRTAFNEVDLT